MDGAEFDADRDEVLARARAAGVVAMVAVGTGPSLAHIERAVKLAEREPDVWAAVGVHPHDAGRITEAWWPRLEELAHHPRVVGIGETGLDFHYDSSPRDVAREAFRADVRLARRVGKPVICHVRDAHADTAAILAEELGPDGRGVIHCFTAGPEEAAAYVKLGLYVSFSGIVTFKNADSIRAAVAVVPRERLLIETDCPYLAPVPFRGRRNEPAYLGHTAAAVARAAGLATDELCALTVANTSALFRLTR